MAAEAASADFGRARVRVTLLTSAGRVESQVKDGPKLIYHAGESFYELPGSHHVVSRNASATEPAKLLAVFVVDTDNKALTTPDK